VSQHHPVTPGRRTVGCCALPAAAAAAAAAAQEQQAVAAAHPAAYQAPGQLLSLPLLLLCLLCLPSCSYPSHLCLGW
jgi:hypothetical protein